METIFYTKLLQQSLICRNKLCTMISVIELHAAKIKTAILKV